MTYPVDIVIPIWNRPIETRACLAALVECSPEARIIMVNYGSERETERILDEFADALDDRAMLVSTGRNVGRVAALNHGIMISSAPLVVIVQEEVKVRRDWLAPLMEIMAAHPDVGLAVPSKGGKRQRAVSRTVPFHEVDHGSLGIMMLRRRLFDGVGCLDENMDGALWCLRDYSRRAERAGFRTVCVSVSALDFSEPQQLGSVSRRDERVRTGEMLYRQRWGDQHHFCFALAGPEADGALPEILPAVVMAARLGNSITILIDRVIARSLDASGHCLTHGNITMETLPPFFPGRALKKRLIQLSGLYPAMISVVIARDMDAELSNISPHAFIRMINEYHKKYYGGEEGTDAVNC